MSEFTDQVGFCYNCRRYVKTSEMHPQNMGDKLCEACCDTVGVCAGARRPRAVDRLLPDRRLSDREAFIRAARRERERAYFDDSVEDLPDEW